MIAFRLEGLIAAGVTPFDSSGRLNLEQVPPLVDRLIERGVDGFYVCGSTGEGPSLADDERQAVAEAYIAAAAGRVPVMVQVGHNSLTAAARLAAHAQRAGAVAVSATCPSYFPLEDIESLVASMAQVAAGAPQLPFYYYHIPALTGARFDMVEFLALADRRIPSLAGLKYTLPTLHEFQLCQEFGSRRYDMLWGVDEMLLAAAATGARGAIGSTYNLAAPAYRRILDAVRDGRLEEAREWQVRVATMIRILAARPFHAALRAAMEYLEMPCGPSRLPLRNLTDHERRGLREALAGIGFFEWNALRTTAGQQRLDPGSKAPPAPALSAPKKQHADRERV